MEKVYEELNEVKAVNEKLITDYRNKSELLENLKKAQNQQFVEIREMRLVTEKQGFELEEKTREISELKRANEDLQRCLREKDSVLKRVNEANEKLRANGEGKCKEFEEEKRKLMLELDELSEKNIDMEQKNNVFRAEIEGLKGMLEATEKKKMKSEKTGKGLKEVDVVIKLEEEKNQVEEKLKWKKEQFKHLEEAYEKLQNQFKDSKKESEEEKSTLLDEIYSLQTKLDSKTRISEDLEKNLQFCNSALTQEESRRKHLEIQVSEFKAKYEDVFAEYQDARTQLDELTSKRDEEVAELRQSLSTKETYFKEMKYENGKLQEENRELLVSLKELQEATIQGSGNSALTKLKNKFRKLENVHKNCLVTLKSKEAELEQMAQEVNDYKLQLESKETEVKELELELEHCHSSTAKMRLEIEEIYAMNVKDEITNEESYSLEQTNAALAKAHLDIEEERERVVSLLKRIEMSEEQNHQAKTDYEEKILQVCEALDNTNSDLVAEREKVLALTKQIDSFGLVKEKNKEMLEESEKIRLHLEEQISQLESDSKENIRELDIAYAKLAQEVEKTSSLIRKLESIDQSEEKLEEANKSQLLLSEALETAYSELYEIEFQLWVWKSIAKRLKTELEQNQNLRKRVEASLLEQVGVGEAMRQERNELLHKLKAVSKSSDSEKETLIKMMMRDKDEIVKKLEREVEFLEQDSLRREYEDAVFAHIENESKRMMIIELEKEISSNSQKLEESVSCFRQEATKLRSELETKQREFNAVTTRMQEKMIIEVENEWRRMMIIELEREISSNSQKLEESVSCFRQEATKLRTELETSETEKRELVKEVESLLSEKRNLLCFISELENGMSRLCDEDMKLMQNLERVSFGKENKNGESIGSSPRLRMKHEGVVIEDRSPFRQINY